MHKRPAVERAVNEADRLDLIDPPTLRRRSKCIAGSRGSAAAHYARPAHLPAHRSELERRFLPLVERVGLPLPLTKQWVNGFEVDFYWPDLGFVVETDGLRYHRTPASRRGTGCATRPTPPPG